MITIRKTIALPLILACLGAQAQGEGSYEIQGVFVPAIFDAQKIDLRPAPIDTVLPDRPVRYDLLPAKAEVPAHVDSLEAAKLKVEAAQQRLYKGFIKAGFGLYTTPLAELYYDQTRSRENGYGLHVKHLSSNGGLDDVGPSDYSFNSVDAFYKHFLPEHEASGRLIYDRRRVSYYGYASNDSIEDVIQNAPDPGEDATRQIYNDIGFAARLRSLYADSSKLAHDIGIEVHSYSNLSESRETNMRVTADVGKQEKSEYFSAGLLIDNNTYTAQLDGDLGESKQNGALVGLMPSVRTVGQKYFVKVGVGMYLDAMGKTTFHFFPQVYAHYGLFDNILVPYAGLEGSRDRTSFRSLTRQNPWLGGGPPLSNTQHLDIYGGLRGSFMNNMGFDVRVSHSAYEDLPLFQSVPNPPFGDRMAVVYDQVGILDLSGEVTYSRTDELRFSGRVDIYTYDVKVQDEAWNLPPYKLTFAVRYGFRDKLILKAEALFMGKRPAYRAPVDDASTSTVADLDGYLDLYLGAEYRYTKRLSLFLDMSNLSASKYERWYGMPVQRGLVLGGATFAF